MRLVTTEEAQRFLIRPDSWKSAEENELKARTSTDTFYWAQLEKIQAFGIKIDGGYASHVVKGCTPSRAVYTMFWVLSGIEVLMRRGFDYFSAVQLIDWIVMVVADNRVHDDRLKLRMEKVFSALGFPELDEFSPNIFYEKVLVGIRRVCSTIRYSSEHHTLMYKLAGAIPEQLSSTESTARREKVLQGYDSHFRRELNIWQVKWLRNSAGILMGKFGMSEDVAVDLIKMVLIAARSSNNSDRSSSHQQWKYRTQDMLTELGLSLNEPGTRKFFEDLFSDILSEIARFEMEPAVLNFTRPIFR